MLERRGLVYSGAYPKALLCKSFQIHVDTLQRRVLEEDTSLAQMTVDTARATTLADLDTALILWQAYLVCVLHVWEANVKYMPSCCILGWV